TWLDGNVVVVALMVFAIACSSSGAIMWSFLATMYHEGFFFQAAVVTLSPKALAAIGPWVAAMIRVCDPGRSCAKSLATASRGSDRNPALSCFSFWIPGGGG